MASVKQLKKKINQQSFKVLRLLLFSGENQKADAQKLAQLMEDVSYFEQVSIGRINAAKRLAQEERRAELKSVEEQLKDKEIYFRKTVISA